MTRALLTVLLVVLAGRAAAAKPVRILVAAGENAGLASEPMLRHAAEDAQKVVAVMVALGSVAPANALLLRDRGAAALQKALERAGTLARAAGPDVELFVYFSGHGDADHLHLSGERLLVSALERMVAAVPARLHVVVLDACRSGDGRRKGLVPEPAFALSVTSAAGTRGTVLIRSSSDGEAAQESDELDGGVFTHFLLSALRGSGDSNGDGEVTLDEAYAYAFHRTLRRSATAPGTLQHGLADMVIEAAGPLVITRPALAHSRLVLQSASERQYLVYRLPAGTLVAEVWGSRTGPVTVALPAGRFLVQRRGGGPAGACEVALPYGGKHVVADADFVPISIERLVAKGGAMLLREHELGVGYGVISGGAIDLGHELQLRYGYRFPTLVLSVGVELGRGSAESAGLADDQRWIGGDVRVEWRSEALPIEWRVAAGAALSWISQTLVRSDAAEVTAGGYPAEHEATALAIGPLVHGALQLPVGGGFAWALGVTGAVLFVREQGSLAPRWSVALGTGLMLEF